MLVCAKLAFKGRYILVLVFQGSFYDGQAALCFYTWLYVHSFLLKLLSVVFNLSAKLNEVKTLSITHQDDAKVTEALREFYICQSPQLFLICKSVKKISSLKHSANFQKRKKEHNRIASQSMGSKLRVFGFESFALYTFLKKKKPKEEKKTCFPYC